MATNVTQMELDMLNLEQVVVGDNMVVTTVPTAVPVADTKPVIVKPVINQPYQHDSLQCFQCFITFCNAKAKERHMRKSHREEYKQQLQQTDTLFTCYVCDRPFTSSEELTQHQATHSTEAKPFRCPHCQGSFATFSELTDHRRNLCPERHCVCKDCGMVFRGLAKLRTHRLAHHPASDASMPPPPPPDGFTHRCPKCQEGFETEEELLQHQELYAGHEHCKPPPNPRKRGRPPKQPQQQPDATEEEENGEKKDTEGTDGAATQPEIGGNIAANAPRPRGRPPKQKQQQPPQPKKPKEEPKIPCPMDGCKTVCGSLALLRAHKKEAHAPPPPPKKAHACSECEESFAQERQLQAHVARAHGSGRHTCPTCGKSFGRESNLKAHQRSHTEGKEEEDEEDKG
ncbi:zinc finger protein 575-like [Engraulis encrasicolus]|uniref:zinc finger protein 575-like n=1 Tax=Engraulis encrasicolus TaxID=184585 RepID=UPI002FD6F7DA